MREKGKRIWPEGEKKYIVYIWNENESKWQILRLSWRPGALEKDAFTLAVSRICSQLPFGFYRISICFHNAHWNRWCSEIKTLFQKFDSTVSHHCVSVPLAFWWIRTTSSFVYKMLHVPKDALFCFNVTSSKWQCSGEFWRNEKQAQNANVLLLCLSSIENPTQIF